MEAITGRLKRVADDILYGPIRPVHFTWECIVHCGNTSLKAFKLVSRDILRDYSKNAMDAINIEILLTVGHYSDYIYPNRRELKITLIGKHVGEQSDAFVPNAPPFVKTYAATLLNATESKLETDPTTNSTVKKDSQEYESLMPIKFQLIDLIMEKLRLHTVGGGWRKCVPVDVLKTQLHIASDSVEIEEENKIKGVQVVPPNNETIKEHVLIKTGTPLVNLAQYIQQQCGGVYNNGIGLYMQSLRWYVYPLFDITRYKKESYNLTVLIVTGKDFAENERTYSFDNDKLIVLAQGEVSHKDRRNEQQLNKGTGTRFIKPTEIFGDNWIKEEENKVTLNRSAILNEIELDKRKDGLTNAPFSSTEFTENTAFELSKLSLQNGQLITVQWKYCNIDLICPGMPCKVMYSANGGLVELEGTVLQTAQTTQSVGQGYLEKKYRNIGAITMFVGDAPPLEI